MPGFSARSRRANSFGRIASSGLAGLIGCACGGGAALNHPAHPLPDGRFSVGTGLNNQFALGQGASAITTAHVASSAEPATPADVKQLERGALSLAAFAPGLSPWLGVRAGIGGSAEVGATYTGRAARADARYAFADSMFALSLGGGLSAIADRPNRGGMLGTNGTEGMENVDLGGVHGWGADVPVLIGARSDASLIQAWLGARGAFERLGGDFHYQLGTGPQQSVGVSATRWQAGGLVGFSIGVRPISVVVELDAAYQWVSGELRPQSQGAPPPLNAELHAVTLTPSGALVGQF